MQVSESWAVRYRPRKLSEFVGQPRAVALVKGMRERGEFPNALLIDGPTGSGKTTLARLIAAVVNDLEGSNVDNSPDIIELNIGSNNKVEDARNLTSQLDFVPSGKFRVFILDEVHQQTNQAASALLKHLEEPPAHVIFILATNTPNKLLATIRNRCVNISLNRVSNEAIIKLLTRAVRKEKLKKAIDSELIARIAEYSAGNPRESLQTLQATANLIAGGYKPGEALKESLLAVGDHQLERVATKFLLGAYQNSLKTMVRALHDTEDFGGLLRIMPELNAYLVAKFNGAKTYHSPARRELYQVIESRGTLTNPAVVGIHQKLTEAKAKSMYYSVPERDLLISLAGELSDK